jgi:hypothetical protein
MRLTHRGKVVVALFVFFAFWGLWEIVTHLWYSETGFCWGDMTVCEFGK